MKEISNNEFDRIFREKTENFDYSFEEQAWNLMEDKLRRRSRYVIFRNTSAMLLLFLLFGTGYYFLQKEDIDSVAVAKKEYPVKIKIDHPGKSSNEFSEYRRPVSSGKMLTDSAITVFSLKKPDKENPSGKASVRTFLPASDFSINALMFRGDDIDEAQALMVSPDFTANLSGFLSLPDSSLNARVPEKKKVKNPNTPGFSLSLSAGPDFSSTESIAGRKGKLNAGLMLNMHVKKLTLSSGVKYGAKKYGADVYDYQLSNPARASMISGIDASCNVLEVPLQVSYALINSEKRKIELSTSLSSYFMLDEKYLFRYTPESGIRDFLLEKKNENKHILSVVGISASYSFKPINKNLQLGIEPYVKLPLGGVGEGKVRLKSSGISLNMTYDLSKKL